MSRWGKRMEPASHMKTGADRWSSKYKGAGKKDLRTFENQKIRWCSWSSVDKWNMR